MGEKNNERKKILLVIAIFIALIALSVGGVYAYFSARATNSGQNITGRTLDINGSTLTIAASRVNLNPSPAPVSDNLLPAKFGVDPTEMTTTQVNKALTKSCVVGGYTGCHVWKITASATQDIPTANIRLNLNVNTVTDKDEWSYVVYTGTDSEATSVLNKGLINTDFGNTTNTIDIHNGASLSNGTPVIYYVMVYLNNTNSVQNDGVNDNTTDETGAYNGSVILEAMGGEVKVNFLEEESTDLSFFIYRIDNSEVTIIRYIKSTVTYTVSDRSACESYLQNKGINAPKAVTLCNGEVSSDICAADNPYCFNSIESGLKSGKIPSNDYAIAGLSNVVITRAPTDVVIPSEIQGYPVTSIGGSAFSNNSLTSVVIPNSVTSIGEDAFSNNSLTSVVIPNSVTSIGEFAFSNNSLTSVVIPNSVTSIGEFAFEDNPLTSITIENTSTTIGDCAFGINPPLDEPFLSNYVCE